MSYLGDRNFLIEVAKGKVPGHSIEDKFGSNPSVGTTFEDIWDAGGIWVPPTAPRIHQIVSTSTDDDEGGIGAEKLKIFGLDGSFNLQEEDI